MRTGVGSSAPAIFWHPAVTIVTKSHPDRNLAVTIPGEGLALKLWFTQTRVEHKQMVNFKGGALDDIEPVALAALAVTLAACTGTFVYLVWKRQWSWMGLFVATGCLIASVAHFQMLVQMVFQLDYASNPNNIGVVVWQYGLGWGVLLFAISSNMLAAMIAALRAPSRWGTASLCLASVYLLLTTGAWSVERWISLGDLPSLSFGIEWPVWIGFPAFLALICGPFVGAIPWSLARQAQANRDEAAGVIAQFRVIAGTVAILLTVIGGSVAIGLLQNHLSMDAQTWRVVSIFALALALTIVAAFVMMIGFRRSFLAPAIAIIEGISASRPLDNAIKPGSLWQPMVDTLDSARSQVRERGAQLAAFFDNLPTSIYLKTIDHEVIYVSKHLAEQYGKWPEDMVGKYEYELHIEAMKPLLMAMDEHIIATGQPVLTEGRHLQFDRLELVSRFPVFNDKGEITHIGGMNFDIDARARAQAELAESKALVDAFIQNAPNSMVLMKPNGQYVLINDAAARFYDKTPEELLAAGPKVLNAPFPEAQSKIVPMMARVIANLNEETIETPFVMPTGEVRDIEFMLFPILGADGKIAFVGNISHDITAERRAQSELVKSTDALHQSEKLAALGQLLAGVSHELNNPLAAVIGQAELLAEDLEGTGHAERVGKIRRAADRCARIVHSFLAMARQKAPEYRKAALNDLVRQAIELTEYQMRTANVVIDLQLGENLPAIEADTDQLHQVIVNLLTNARQATDENAGERRITISTSRLRGQVRLHIADNGNGIPAEARARIFEPFFSTKEVGSGTGIGLSYSLGIVEMHGGTLALDDADIGSAFTITLPVANGSVTGDDLEPAAQAKAKGRVLVVDDEADIAETLVDMLSRMGLDVTFASGGAEGQAAMADRADFDLVLSDIRMPDVDGPALYAWMAAHRPELLPRLAFVTGDTMGERAAEFLGRVDCPVLEKPFTAAALRELVDRMMKP
jgi:PAS domain S-box-containing protein